VLVVVVFVWLFVVGKSVQEVCVCRGGLLSCGIVHVLLSLNFIIQSSSTCPHIGGKFMQYRNAQYHQLNSHHCENLKFLPVPEYLSHQNANVFQARVLASNRTHASIQSAARLGSRPVRGLRPIGEGLHAHVREQRGELHQQCQSLRRRVSRGAEQAEDEAHRGQGHPRRSQSVSHLFFTW